MGITRKPEPAIKAERKKPVRKSPALKNYPNKLAWLKAMTEYEQAQAEGSTEAKVARLDKRIAAKDKAVDDLNKEIDVLRAERHLLVPIGFAEPEPEPEAEAEGPDPQS